MNNKIIGKLSIIFSALLLVLPVIVKAEEAPIAMPKISEEMMKQAGEVVSNVKKIQANQEYKNHQNWIAKNNQTFFERQSEKLPTIDYNITKKQLEKDAIAKLLNNYRFKSEDIKKAQITNYPLMIFVSSSIPKSSLKDLMIQAKKAGGILVFKGLIKNLKTTAEFLSAISKDDVQAIIDPRLFDLFNIKSVPTIIVLKEANQDCNINGCQITPVHDRISGNITLDYALQTITDGKSEASPVAAEFLTKIRAGGMNEKN